MRVRVFCTLTQCTYKKSGMSICRRCSLEVFGCERTVYVFVVVLLVVRLIYSCYLLCVSYTCVLLMPLSQVLQASGRLGAEQQALYSSNWRQMSFDPAALTRN